MEYNKAKARIDVLERHPNLATIYDDKKSIRKKKIRSYKKTLLREKLLFLRNKEELTLSEIGQVLGMTHQAVQQQGIKIEGFKRRLDRG